MASELLWRRLSEAEKKAIEQKAKKIILEFGKTLEKLRIPPIRKEVRLPNLNGKLFRQYQKQQFFS